MIEWIIFALIGVLSGLSAGLLGLGGGVIIVPALLMVFSWQDVPESQLIHLAISTSLMTIIVTSLASTYAHHQNKNVNWRIVRQLLPGLIIGGFSGAFFATMITGELLQKAFAFYAFIAVVLMWYRAPPFGDYLLNKPILFVASTITGVTSALVGIGGGSFIVPYLVMAKQPITRAIGSSTACGLPISIAAVIGFFIFSSNVKLSEKIVQTEFIHWQAFFGIISTSMLFSMVGARLAKTIPKQILKKIFSLILIFVGIALLN